MKRKIGLISNHAFTFADLRDMDSEGQSEYPSQIARNLARLGYQVDIFVPQEEERLPEVYEWMDNIRVIPISLPSVESVRKENLPGVIEALTEYTIEFFNRQVKSYDLVHANSWMSGLVAAEIKTALGTPFVISFQAPEFVVRQPPKEENDFLEARTVRMDRMFREADGIIVESWQDREELISRYAVNPIHIVQMENITDRLAVFYENILAVRRVAIGDNAIGPLAENQQITPPDILEHAFESKIQILQQVRESFGGCILDAANLMIDCVDREGGIMVGGNVRNLADPQNFDPALAERSAGLEGAAPPFFSLKENSALMTALSNEIGDNKSFSGHVQDANSAH